MELIDRAVEGKYWVVYYLVYAAGVATGLALYWPEITGADTPKDARLFLLAGIVGLSAGTALMSVIIVEVTGRMVLLIPAAWRKAKAEGRAEGRTEEHDRVQSIITQFGQVDPDTGTLTLGPEAQEQLLNGSGKR